MLDAGTGSRMSNRTAGRAWVKWLIVGLLSFSSAHAVAQSSEGGDAEHWQPGQPAPGYHVARKHTLGVVGGSIFAGGYGFSALYGTVFLTECYAPGADGRASDPCHPNPEYRAAPFLFIPIAGPFLTFTNRDVRNDGGAVFWFSFFGVAQVTGAALLAYDLAVPHYGLKRGDGPQMGAAPRLVVAPTYLGRGPGLAVLGEF